jgi:hypothetical protein
MDPIEAGELVQEVADSNFEDERLNRRLGAIVAVLASDPTKSLPGLFDSAGLEAAYRFFANHRVTPVEILAPHVAATKERCTQHPEFLIAHDSTTFSYRRDGEREGLGRARRGKTSSAQSFYGHVSLAIASDGTRRPLGLGALRTWTRDAKTKASWNEAWRWEEQVCESSALLDATGRAIHLMDREADDYQMFDALIRGGHRFVARCLFNRWTESPTGDSKLRALFESVAATIDREVSLTRRKSHRDKTLRKLYPPRASRTATLSVAGSTVSLKKPKMMRSKRHLDLPASLTLNVVRVWEPQPPEGEVAVEWYLYTTESISTTEELLRVVDHYRARWTVEEFFKALKTGCDFESRQLHDYEGLTNLLATFAPIAYRLLLLRSEARRVPDESALTVVTADHIAVLRIKGRTKLSENPTTHEIYRAIAILGGHIKHRKEDPGWLTLARGFEKLDTLTEGWVAAKMQHGSDQR